MEVSNGDHTWIRTSSDTLSLRGTLTNWIGMALTLIEALVMWFGLVYLILFIVVALSDLWK